MSPATIQPFHSMRDLPRSTQSPRSNWEANGGRHRCVRAVVAAFRRLTRALGATFGWSSRRQDLLPAKAEPTSQPLAVRPFEPTLQQLVSDLGASSLLAYARRFQYLSLFRLAWRLGAGRFAVRDVFQVMLSECTTPHELRIASYVLLIGSVNDIMRDYLAEGAEDAEDEAPTVVARTLVAWWYAVASHVQHVRFELMVRDLLHEIEVPRFNARRKSQSAKIRKIFDRYWPVEGGIPSEPTAIAATAVDLSLFEDGRGVK